MLSEDKIDYLLQIRDSKPPLRSDTVRIILSALRWDEEEIQRGLEFLGRPGATDAQYQAQKVPLSEPEISVEQGKPINIKQNPFPLGTPFAKMIQVERERMHTHHVLAGFMFGGIFISVVMVVYAYIQNAGV